MRVKKLLNKIIKPKIKIKVHKNNNKLLNKRTIQKKK